MKELNNYVNAFFPQDESHHPSVTISGGDLFDILQRLTLTLDVNPSGLGAANLLFIATELLLLQSEKNNGLNLALIEELEAHLHPQAQLRLIKYLEEKSTNGQSILTTHSTTLGSSIPLENLIICKNNKAFPMGREYTKLSPRNYDYLGRFLDATKANLFFAKGVLLVEGDAENLLIPTIATIIDRPLHRHGVSIVNVGSTAFDHFVEIFDRQDGDLMGIKVALITDMDVKPLEYPPEPGISRTTDSIKGEMEEKIKKISDLGNDEVKGFVSPNWTLEYEIALSPFCEDFYRSLLWAEKIIQSKTGEPQESKVGEVASKVQSDLHTWRTALNVDPRKNQQIAFKIYKEKMLDKDISKAVTAQVFAQLLTEKFQDPKKTESLKSDLQSATSLKYLVDAIYHVTKPRGA